MRSDGDEDLVCYMLVSPAPRNTKKVISPERSYELLKVSDNFLWRKYLHKTLYEVNKLFGI